ncbi:ribulose-phosphate 3-epimerase [Muriicola jejuensis]|uniref:Ribulose-phosphate 3-epimerase n=1 Tax=Muriicola jejuensis TaxID=504488 RepID=A0A6P0UDH6_9FLAO|nr:ribulose-phosphate 3-epimerase [Muriicola jejuensis]NER09323.1 ribulose-phosphate 3-epimerase [Muriicola jejuensis]SMP09406.1 ribulose-phosphate 3-epimerase [Muriicola jejuensis]
MNQVKIAPSLLAADFGNLQRDVEMVNESDAAWHHLDIMDGVFVPNISYGMPVVKAIAKHASKPLDAHLMIIDPDRYIQTFADLGVYLLTVHYEACQHLHRTVQAIRAAGMKAGVALNPHTDVSLLKFILKDLDLVLVMSVNPGFGGQSFIPATYDKIRTLKKMLKDQESSALIEVDGGVGPDNASKLIDAGADVLVAGSSVFKAKDPKAIIAEMASVKVS